MTIIDVLQRIPHYKTRIQVAYFPDKMDNWREDRSQIMQVGNITYKHIDHWSYKKEVRYIIPAVDKKGEPYLYIQLQDVRSE